MEASKSIPVLKRIHSFSSSFSSNNSTAKMIPCRRVAPTLLLFLLFFSVGEASSHGLGFLATPVNQTIMEQREAMFFCSVNSSDVTVTWLVNGVKVNPKRHNMVVASSAGRSTLVLPQAKKKDQGHVIQCRVSAGQSQSSSSSAAAAASTAAGAQNEFALTSPSAYLNVIKGRVPDGFPRCTIASSLQVFEVERPLVLLWSVEGDPHPAVSFVRDHVTLDSSDSRMKMFSTDDSNYILQVDRAQEVDSGRYKCVATSVHGTANSDAVQVYVKKRLFHPYFSILPEDTEVVPGADVDFTCVAVGSPMPHVKWLNGTRSASDDVTEGRNVLRLKDVQVPANLTCVAYSELGEIFHSVHLRVKVSQKGPEDVRVNNVTSTSAHVQWSLADGDFENVVFRLSYRPVVAAAAAAGGGGGDGGGGVVAVGGRNDTTTGEIKRETHQTQMTLTDLRPHTEYVAGVELHCDAGVSRTSFVRFTTAEAAPSSPPRRVRGSTDGWNVISVAWDEPLEPNGIIQGYKVFYEDERANKLMSNWRHKTVTTTNNNNNNNNGSTTTTTTVLLTNLQPDVRYKISVQAYTGEGVGPPSEPISISMRENSKPEPPGGLRVDLRTSRSVTLRWQHSISSDVDSYLLECRPMRFVDEEETTEGEGRLGSFDGGFAVGGRKEFSASVPSGRNSHVLENLFPGVVYEFKVAARSSRGTSDYSPTVRSETLEEVPSSAPENLHAEALDSTTIRVVWKPIARGKRNGKVLGYRILHSTSDPARNREEEEEEEEEEEGARGAGGITINVPHPEHVWVLRGLAVWSRHRFKVAGYTGVGDGPWSNPVSIRTFEDVPGVPRRLRLTVQSSTSVLVMWRPPLEQNGLIQGYQIFYLELDKSEQLIGNQMIKDVENGLTDQFLVTGLKSGTSYDFQIAAYTRRGDGPRSKPKRVKTTVPAIGQPQNFSVSLKETNPPMVLATWHPPQKSPGSIQGYRVVYQARDATDENLEEINLGGETNEALTKPLVKGVEYEFQVMARSLNEFGSSAFAYIHVPEGAPMEIPEMVSARRLSTSTAFISWKPVAGDDHRSGRPGEYKVKLREKNSWAEEEEEIVTSHSTLTELTLNGLRPNATYVVQVASCVTQQSQSSSSGCSEWSETRELKSLESQEGSSMTEPNLKAPRASRISSTTAMVELDGDPSEMSAADGSRYFLVVARHDGADTGGDPRALSTDQLLAGKESSPAAWICGQFLASHFPVKFLVGDGSTGRQFSNHRLDMDDHSYRFFVRLRTNNGEEYSSDFSQPLGVADPHRATMGDSREGDQELLDRAGLMMIVVPTCVAFLVVAGLVVAAVFIRKRALKSFPEKMKKKPRDYKIYRNKGDACEVPLNPGHLLDPDGNPYLTTMTRTRRIIPIHSLADKLEELKRNDREHLRAEYESIDSEKQFTWTASNVEENRHKNRYANVVAYDHSRVVLPALPGRPGSDYVNANYIDGLDRQRAYIATQGPMPETFEDFWRMIWECNCSTIVMITKLEERNRIKCDLYWPQHGSELYGRMQVTLKDVLELASYTIRTFTLSVRDFMETREVYQLQFTSWPDHGVPEYPTLLLQFVKRVRAANTIHGGPLVVHCSAGVGRTGTMIAVDICLDHAAQFGTVDVLGCVTKLRSQRNYMVQSDDQYQFVYEAVLEAASTPGDTEVPADQLCACLQDLGAVDPKTGFSKLSFEYSKLSIIQYDPSQFQNSNLACNKAKNRSNGILALDSNRVCLQPIRGVDGSDYINASFVDGYKHQQSYIATQYPMIDTMNDFWRMIWESNCCIIVMLANSVESGIEKCHQYWPDDRSMRYQYFVLDPVTTINLGQYFIREFKMTDARDGQSRIIYHFQFIDWMHAGPEFSASGQQFINFIGQVENMRGKVPSAGPIVVHCPSGVGRTGVFVALSYVLERMRTEGVVNLFETAKILRTQRPFMIQNEEQYAFCYRAASEYLTSFDHYTK